MCGSAAVAHGHDCEQDTAAAATDATERPWSRKAPLQGAFQLCCSLTPMERSGRNSHQVVERSGKMNIEIEEATFKISEVTYQELKEIQAALMNAGSEEALEIGIALEDSLCCLL